MRASEPELQRRVSRLMPRLKAELARLVGIPSVTSPGFAERPGREAAEAVRELFHSLGLLEMRLIEAPGEPPIVYGHRAAPPEAPTVLLYAHYDVQPAGDEAAWLSDPFAAIERDQRLYGRGAADDKGGIVLHYGALRALQGHPSVGLKLVIEGAEERGSPGLCRHVPDNPSLYAADAAILADGGNVARGSPTLSVSTRGLVAVDVAVETLDAPRHSGAYGGPAPDALVALSRMIASLHDDAGNVAIAGLNAGEYHGAPICEEDYVGGVGLLPGVALIGDGTLAERLLARPAVNVIALDAPDFASAGNVIIPRVRARVSVRLAPSQDAVSAQSAVICSRKRVPARTTTSPGCTSSPCLITLSPGAT
jgi:acetylornithine deacetylase/succinyl-diaminopimelate desuccinylase-like protein